MATHRLIQLFFNSSFSLRSRRSQVYPLMFGSQAIPILCLMGIFECGDGGWTLAMKIDGKQVNSLSPLRNSWYYWNEHRVSKMQFLSFRELSITIPNSGATEMPITLLEARLALIPKRPSYQPTGTHPSPRSALVWRLMVSPSSLSSTGTPTHCSHWSLMGNTVPPHWVVTRGSRWLVHRLPCRSTAVRKDSMRWEATLVNPKQESASRLTGILTVVPVTPASVLAQEVDMMISTRAEMRQRTRQIMKTSTSKP